MWERANKKVIAPFIAKINEFDLKTFPNSWCVTKLVFKAVLVCLSDLN